MEMEKQQEKLAGQIQKAEEQLKKLREKDTELKKRMKEKREKKQAAWTVKFDKLLQPFIERKYGVDYFETISPKEAAEYFSCIIGVSELGGGDGNGHSGGYEDH
ncbi:MAG: hypothetical protein LUI13_02330 [Lachnospiraceae bacterium]|nr:hypothetical protein [Lachnospiraceae bacterium]